MKRALPGNLEIPLIETDRLRLRGHAIDDFVHSRELWGDAAVTQFIGGKPLTEEESWSRLLRYLGHWALLGFGYWVVEERESGEFVGEVGFADYKREMEPPLGAIPELGWVLAKKKQGKGYATEAVNAALRWGLEQFGSREVACLIHPDHRSSIRVATKCGFEERWAATYKGSPTIVFKRAL
jgi:RimJ/RimL family protein N-acetyltransferase